MNRGSPSSMTVLSKGGSSMVGRRTGCVHSKDSGWDGAAYCSAGTLQKGAWQRIRRPAGTQLEAGDSGSLSGVDTAEIE